MRRPPGRLDSHRSWTDRRGWVSSVLSLTDSTGNTDTATYSYQPYGATASSSGTLATTNPFRFASGYQLTSPSIYHYGDRYYNQASLRWTTRDPIPGGIVNPQTVDRYPYAGDDPLTNEDLSGDNIFGDALQVVGESISFGSSFVPVPGASFIAGGIGTTLTASGEIINGASATDVGYTLASGLVADAAGSFGGPEAYVAVRGTAFGLGLNASPVF